MTRRPAARALALAAILAASPGLAQPVPGSASADAAVSVYSQLDANLDQGGKARYAGVLAAAGVQWPLTSQLTAGIGVRYDYESWTFEAPAAFAGRAPWTDIQRPSIALPLRYAVTADTLVALAPSVQWAYESGASTGDALNYGALLSVARVFSPTLTLGIGAGVYREIDETKAFPFLLIDWRFAPQWRVGNPFPAGPAGGAGVELAYAPSDAWEFAAGGTWRQFRFRLDHAGPVPDGIGESRGIPLFLRASYRFAPGARLDAYAGAVLDGKLTVQDSGGHDVASDPLGAAPIVGLTVSARF